MKQGRIQGDLMGSPLLLTRWRKEKCEENDQKSEMNMSKRIKSVARRSISGGLKWGFIPNHWKCPSKNFVECTLAI